MADGAVSLMDEARARAYSTPLEDFHVADIAHFTTDTLWPWFERLRREDPVHYTADSEYGPYWSLTRYADVVTAEGDHARLSSSAELGGVTLENTQEDDAVASFISLDPPRHDAQRKVVTPVFSTASLTQMEPLIRSRAAKILDELPRGETFDFVDKVAVELTSQMLATLFDFPFEERRLLPRASDLMLQGPAETPEAEAARQTELYATFTRFVELWNERTPAAPAADLISLLAHDPATDGDHDPMRYMGNVVLLIIAGSDTTRHSITGGLIALNQHPDQYAKLRANPAVIPTMVPEIIRWQSPVAYMRRTALEDVEIGGKTIRRGEKVAMWYVSANRDEGMIEDPDAFIIDRARPRQHAAFGFGIHRCIGQRLAEMQLRVMWEEIIARFPFIEVVGEPVRLKSNFVKGFVGLPVRIPD